ncbi:MAG: alpha/beta fold hydrolase [Pseudomonadales bacterium]|nr:alpha/beta fold hydrolase [Pseudomonadales bacterium]
MKKKEIDAAAIVALIYEKIQTPHLYQGLTPRDDHILGGFEITDQEHLNSSSKGMLSTELLDEVAPHLEQAINMIGKQQKLTETQPFSASVSFFDLPLPVCLLSNTYSNTLELLEVNHSAKGMLVEGVNLPFKATYALTLEQSLKKDILTAVARTLETNKASTVTLKARHGVIRTILVVPRHPEKNNTAMQAAVLFLNHESRVDELAMALIKTHGLTQSEAEVAAYLAQGLAPEQIAAEKNCSLNTVRTQIKKLFTKPNTTRQAQLVSLVYSGPALWMNILNDRNTQASNRQAEADTTSNAITLTDGRTMSYGDYGPRNGLPVVLFHHLFGSRNDKPEDETLLPSLGIRLIIPERPGVGQSCSTHEINLLATINDVLQLVDKLEIDRFHVAGLSAGAPFATAFAAITADRTIKLGLIAAQMPVEELPKGIKVGTIHRFLTSVARYLPSMVLKQLEHNYSKLLANPEEMLSEYKSKTNSADKRLHQDPRINRIRLQNIQDAATRNPYIYARDLTAGFRPWGCKLSELQIPVILWHGKQDELFPYEHAQAMADLIPNCKTVFSDNWGHFFPLQEWESIYRTLIE